ncbi:MAG: extracellular solute-binding protein, partial [Geminicoccaceae bacterium]
VSRRHLLKIGASAALAAGAAPSIIIPGRARAQQKTLKILQWKNFMLGYDQWFNETYVKQWGERNDTQVIVDNVGLADLISRGRTEAEARRGHDLVLFWTPPAAHEDQVIDHREIYEECERRYGKVADFAVRSTYNPRTRKHIGFCPAYQPAVTTYRKDLWDAVRSAPDSWADVLPGGRRIKLLHGSAVGISLAPETNAEQTLRAIMYSFGASEQDGDGNPALKSKATLETIKYVKALYEDAMTRDVLTWDAASNNQLILNGGGCMTLDTIAILRTAESLKLSIAKDLELAKTPEGPAGRLECSFGLYTFSIWSFAENPEGAKRFLVDYTAILREAVLTSGFNTMPTFPDVVPDLAALVAGDAGEGSPGKYGLLAEALSWTTNIGHPGFTNPVIGEVYDRGLIPTMFAQAATGRLTAEEALDQADKEVREIFQKWRERGKV